MVKPIGMDVSLGNSPHFSSFVGELKLPSLLQRSPSKEHNAEVIANGDQSSLESIVDGTRKIY